MPEISPSHDRLVGHLSNPDDVGLAAERMVRDGAVVGVGNTSVYALAGDGGHPDFGDRLFAIKDREPTRTVGLFLAAASFTTMIDMDRVERHVRPLLEDPTTLENTLGDLAFVRAPLRRSAYDDMPDHIRRYTVSQRANGYQPGPYIQAYFAVADTLFANLDRSLVKKGAVFPALSSMNYSGSTEITGRDAANDFCEEQAIDILHDRGRNPLSNGSYPIFETGPTGLTCARQGNIDRRIMARVLAPWGGFSGPNLPLRSDGRTLFRALQLEDLPEITKQTLFGEDVRAAVIEQRLAFENRTFQVEA